MEGFDNHTELHDHDLTQTGDFSASGYESDHHSGGSNGTSVQESTFEEALDSSLEKESSQQDHGHSSSHNDQGHSHGSSDSDGFDVNDFHNHARPDSIDNPLHVSLDAVDVRSLDLGGIQTKSNLRGHLGGNGDLLEPGGGNNTVIGSSGNDIVVGTGGGVNTITTGSGKDMVILGKETTNRIFDFDPSKDILAIADNLSMDDIVIAQGKNPTKAGVQQPFDSENNALVIDKSTEHILAALTFVNASELSASNFVQVTSDALRNFDKGNSFASVQQAGDGGEQLTGTRGRDRLTGGNGDDFLYVGDDGIKFDTAIGTGRENSPSLTTVRA
ncbi:hypothetical protein [Egbenema bharatensis]|uniref:hypothetical protein n=1 Tax=Egbenema bharatensis TaxID=3463334 RepID=UPI003A8496AB